MPSRVGAVVSTTVMWNEPPVLRPPLSVAEQVIVFVPSGSNEPLAGEQVATGAVASSASLAVTVYAAVAPPVLLPSTVVSAGRLRVGGVLVCAPGTSSRIVTDGRGVPNTPLSSVLAGVTVVDQAKE